MRNLLAAFLFCAAAVPASAQDASGARDASAKFTAALSGADAATAGSYFTDDAVALPPGRAPITGRPQIQQFLGGMTHAVKGLKYTTDELRPIDNDTAREVGSFSFKLQNNEVSGKYLLIWTKVGGDWKVAADMWNRNAGGKTSRGGRGAGGGSGRGNAGGGGE